MRAWIGLVAIINLAVVCELFWESGAINGFLRIQETYSPYALGTFVINGALLLPAYLAYRWAEKVQSASQPPPKQT
jgi:hypothetical protein